MTDADAIIIGAGHSGLVAATTLARAGWRVLVIERNAEIGGAVRTAEVTLPGFKHDLFATNVTIFTASPFYRDFKADFDAAGLRFASNGYPYASAYPNGKAARVYVDPVMTEQEMAGHSAADFEGWRNVVALFQRTAPNFLPLHFAAMPSKDVVRHVAKLVRNGPGDAMAILRVVLGSSRRFVDRYFQTPEVKGLFTPWAFHLDYGPDVRGGATFAFIAALSAYSRGLYVAEGGAGRIIDAMRGLIDKYGGRVLTKTEVARINIRDGAAESVTTAAGETIGARRAVVANVTPRLLFGRLVATDDLPAGFARRIARFRYAPGTFVVHLALNRKLEWAAAENLGEFNYVHLYGAAGDIAKAYAESCAGLIPARPMMVVSQTTQVDPSRAPAGCHIARIHARAFPADIAGDAAEKITGRDWPAVKESVADRLVELLAEHAPSVRSSLLARHVVSPRDLEAGNPNLIGGDCNGGSHHLDQSYFFRPLRGWSRYATPIQRLHMIGSSNWPGGGVTASSGYLLARQLLA